MGLVRGITKRIDHPREPGEWAEIRMLGWADLEFARQGKQAEAFQTMRQMGGDVLAALQQQRTVNASGDAAPVDDFAQYDPRALLERGIAAWSYKDKLTPENIGALDEFTADWLAREIHAYSRPPSEDELKN